MDVGGSSTGLLGVERPREPTAATGVSRYRADIQGIRGVAVLVVVLYHAGGVLPGGFVGVDMFFVVSGFVITRMLRDERLARGSISFRRFYARRVRRLLPALATTTVVTMLLSLLVLSPNGTIQPAARTGIAASLFTANLQLARTPQGYFDPGAETNPLLHTWSLSVEEQIYMVVPAFLLALWGTRRVLDRHAISRALGPIVAVALVSLGLGAALTYGRGSGLLDDPARIAFYSPMTRAWEFLAGALLVFVPPLATGRRATVLGAAGGAAIALAVLTFDVETAFPGVVALLPVLGTAALIVAAPAVRLLDGVLSVRPLAWLGDVSYSWYLWHWPAIAFASVLWSDSRWVLLPAAAGALVVGWGSYRLVEQPIRLGRSVLSEHPVGLAVSSIAVPAVVCVATLHAANSGLGLSAADIAAERSESNRRECHVGAHEAVPDPAGCIFNPQGDAGTVALVGDSHADAIADLVIDLATDLDHRAVVVTRGGCPFVDADVATTGCADGRERMMSIASDLDPDVVIVSNRSPAYTRPSVGDVIAPIASEGATRSAALAAWQAGLEGAFERFDASTRIIAVATVPEFDDAGGLFSISLLRPEGTPRTQSLDAVEERRGATVAVLESVAARDTRVALLDPVPHLCDGICSQVGPEGWIFRDEQHVSRAGAERLRSDLLELVSGGA